MRVRAMNDLERAARACCSDLFDRIAKIRDENIRGSIESAIYIAFAFGAAWALDRPDMIRLAKAQIADLKAGGK
jgi:hypothetical protein